MPPKLSIIVIVYRMAQQAMNTLYSLSCRYQWNVQECDYEVIVLENASDDKLDPAAVQALGKNFHYQLRPNDSPSPVTAINAGLQQARGEFIGLLIDGARIVTPRVIEYALMAARLPDNPLVATATYNLGPYLHYGEQVATFGVEQEQRMLSDSRWQRNGYRLFDIANLGEANPVGYFQPLLESNCFFSSRTNFAAIGYADSDFQLPGGGSLNLHMFRAIGMLPSCRHYFLMAGEASFHQQHGGVTTSQEDQQSRNSKLHAFKQQLDQKWGGQFHALEREPTLLGSVTQPAIALARYSAERGLKRFDRLHRRGCYFFQDDFDRPHYTYQRQNDSFTKPEPR